MFPTPLREIADSEESCLIVAKERDATNVADDICSPLLIEEGRDATNVADGVVNA